MRFLCWLLGHKWTEWDVEADAAFGGPAFPGKIIQVPAVGLVQFHNGVCMVSRTYCARCLQIQEWCKAATARTRSGGYGSRKG